MGFEGGQMFGPSGLAVDRAGELLVAEQGAGRIDIFDPRTGRFLRAFWKSVGGPVRASVPASASLGSVTEATARSGSPKDWRYRPAAKCSYRSRVETGLGLHRRAANTCAASARKGKVRASSIPNEGLRLVSMAASTWPIRRTIDSTSFRRPEPSPKRSDSAWIRRRPLPPGYARRVVKPAPRKPPSARLLLPGQSPWTVAGPWTWQLRGEWSSTANQIPLTRPARCRRRPWLPSRPRLLPGRLRQRSCLWGRPGRRRSR